MEIDQTTLTELEITLHDNHVRVWFTPLLERQVVRQTVLAVQVRRNVFRGVWEGLERPWWLDRVRIQVEGVPGAEKPKVRKLNHVCKVLENEPLTVDIEFSDLDG